MLEQNANNQEKKWIKLIPGIFLSLIIAISAWFLGKAFPLIGGPVFAIIAGIAITTVFPKVIIFRTKNGLGFEEGIKYTSKKLLQYSIILLGFEMNLYNVIRVGGQSFFVMIFTLATAFLSAYIMGKILKIPKNTTILIGVGTSICGGSAIAAAAPVIRAQSEEVSQSISTIFLFNIVAVFIFPPLGRLLGMNDTSFGMWAGTAINDTSSVVAAGAAWSTEALQFATIVKLSRTLMIVPITLVLAIYTAGKSKHSAGSSFSFAKVFPWFVIFFIVASVVNTFVLFPFGLEWLAKFLTQAGKFLIVMAMAAIGLSTNLKKLISNGIKPILLGVCCWFVVAVTSLIVQHFTGI